MHSQTYHRPAPREIPILILDDGAVQVFAPYHASQRVSLAAPSRPLRVIHNVADVPEAFIVGGRG